MFGRDILADDMANEVVEAIDNILHDMFFVHIDPRDLERTKIRVILYGSIAEGEISVVGQIVERVFQLFALLSAIDGKRNSFNYIINLGYFFLW